MNLHQNAVKAFNQQAYDLLQHMETIAVTQQYEQELIGSLAHKPTDNWTAKLTDEPRMTSSLNPFHQKLDLYEEWVAGKGVIERTGFTQQKYPEFLKFVKGVHKCVSACISLEFLEEHSIRWLTTTFRNNQSPGDYIDYINIMNLEALRDGQYSFEILNLDVDRSFMLGNVKFDYLTGKDFENVVNKDDAEDEEFVNMYAGRVFASFEIKKTEPRRAEEIAYLECCRAVDVLKIFSRTVAVPEYKTDFDIDRRVKVAEAYRTIYRSASGEFRISMGAAAKREHFNLKHIASIEATGVNFSSLIKETDPNELQKLIINSIAKFAEAISVQNIHKRTVDLLTIWESLLLKNQDSPIQDSVSLYASKILKREVADRKTFISLFKKIYAIRSQVIHHAKEPEIDMDEIRQFQFETVDLMETLIRLSQKHENKLSIIEEIDHAIQAAG